MLRERWEGWLSGQKVKGGTREEERYEGEYNARDDVFVNFSPDFFIELVSHSDSLGSLQRKMEEYLQNGSRLGWLVDPIQRRVYIYRPNQPPEVLEDPEIVSGEAVLPGFELKVREIW
jgi:Uma2 family endonuclease